jgi:FPC/CPF motif-containing protein YcgG
VLLIDLRLESKCIYKSYIGKLGWRFLFCDEPFFITTFAPCYPAHHSRYSYGEPSTWILFQPGMGSIAVM